MTLDTARAELLRAAAHCLALVEEALVPYRAVLGELPDEAASLAPCRLGTPFDAGPYVDCWLETAEATLVVLEALRERQEGPVNYWRACEARVSDYP